MSQRQARVNAVIAALNGISVGDLGIVEARLKAASSELQELNEDELAACLAEAVQAVNRSDIKDFRRLLAQVVARLGHLRESQPLA